MNLLTPPAIDKGWISRHRKLCEAGSASFVNTASAQKVGSDEVGGRPTPLVLVNALRSYLCLSIFTVNSAHMCCQVKLCLDLQLHMCPSNCCQNYSRISKSCGPPGIVIRNKWHREYNIGATEVQVKKLSFAPVSDKFG